MSFAKTNGVCLHFQIDGPEDAPAVMFINALGTDLGMWDSQISAFTARYRVIRHDCRGHGESDCPPGPYSIESLAADALGLLDELELASVNLCGISTGGMVSMWLAADYPERIGRAIFGSTAARIGSVPLWEERARAVTSGGMASVADAVIKRLLSDSFRKRDPATTAKVEATLRSCPPEGYAATCLALRDGDLSDLVGNIKVPSLIVTGVDDVATPAPAGKWLHDHIPNSQLVVLDDASHLCNVEQPARFNDVVLGFLSAEDGGVIET